MTQEKLKNALTVRCKLEQILLINLIVICFWVSQDNLEGQMKDERWYRLTVILTIYGILSQS